MAALTLWDMQPSGQPINFITPAVSNKLYYSRGMNVLGELNIAASPATVRQWALPDSLSLVDPLSGAGPTGIAVVGSSVYCALFDSNAVVCLNLASNLVNSWILANGSAPIVSPRHLQYDGTRVWFAGPAQTGVTPGPMVGYFTPGSATVTSWNLASQLPNYAPTGLCVAHGNAWLSVAATQPGNDKYFLVRVDSVRKELTCWYKHYATPPGIALLTGGLGIDADDPACPQELWCSYGDPHYPGPGGAGWYGALQMDPLSPAPFIEHATGSGFAPEQVTVAARGKPWFGGSALGQPGGRVGTVTGTCGISAPVQWRTASIAPAAISASRPSATVMPTALSAPAANSSPAPVNLPCAWVYNPGVSNVTSINATPGQSGATLTVFFANGTRYLGRLVA